MEWIISNVFYINITHKDWDIISINLTPFKDFGGGGKSFQVVQKGVKNYTLSLRHHQDVINIT